MNTANKRKLGYLLILVLAIIYIQVIVGGITRLTGSGLSMTDWKIVTGTIPPIGQEAWQAEFDQYKQSPQYSKLNEGMTLSQFQGIFFWEWLHRVWGRWGFMVILGIFLWFWLRKKLDAVATGRFLTVLILYIAQGLLGWFMVKSGLVDMPWVSHYRLTAHLLLAIFLFAYILWFVADLFVAKEDLVQASGARNFLRVIIMITIIQIIFGGFMSGLHAAQYYPSWPDMNGQLLPPETFSITPWYMNFLENRATIQFTHRGIAYLLCVLIMAFWWKARQINTNNLIFKRALNSLPLILSTQVLLGVLVLLNSSQGIPVSFGVMHQAVGLLLLSTLLFVGFQFKKA